MARTTKRRMMRCIVGGALAAAMLLARPAAATDVTTVAGTVEFVSKDAIEVAGTRGLITSATSIVSDGHPVSLASVHEGMSAEMELDPAGEALEIRVKGAVE